jgi:hypothetical protein
VLAAAWGATRLQGVDPENHVKGKWNLRHSRLRFDYRGFWAEHEGVREDSGNWTLPLDTALRPLEEVPTKRRAMYRRRYAMLDALQVAVDTLADARHAGAPAPVASPELETDAANASTLEPALVA